MQSWCGWPPADPRPWPAEIERNLGETRLDEQISSRSMSTEGTYQVVELDVALEDLATAPGHDRDLHAPLLPSAGSVSCPAGSSPGEDTLAGVQSCRLALQM